MKGQEHNRISTGIIGVRSQANSLDRSQDHANSALEAEEEFVVRVQIVDAQPKDDGCICSVRILSGGVLGDAGQILNGIYCPIGLYIKGQDTLLFFLKGDVPILAPNGSSQAATIAGGSGVTNSTTVYNQIVMAYV